MRDSKHTGRSEVVLVGNVCLLHLILKIYKDKMGLGKKYPYVQFHPICTKHLRGALINAVVKTAFKGTRPIFLSFV